MYSAASGPVPVLKCGYEFDVLWPIEPDHVLPTPVHPVLDLSLYLFHPGFSYS